MMTSLLWISIVLLVILILLTLSVVRRFSSGLSPELKSRLDAAERALERVERSLRDDLARGREEASSSSRNVREEMTLSLKNFNDSVVKSMAEMGNLQKNQLELFAGQIEGIRTAVDARLKQIQDESNTRLEQMRLTVDEKLQGTLEKRLGESFKLVSERLELVHRGLGEMQTLAAGVGDLKKVLTNVKARGTWGEVQLQALLDQVLAPEQYASNVVTKEGSSERVEFALRLPGRNVLEQKPVWLPIDAKFPQEDYLRLLDASDRGDADGVEAAARQLELRIRSCCKDIRDKYIDPPNTTDFGILFLPIEGLYAEVLRRAALAETLQREFRIVIAGPTTLWAILNSLQMGFRTLAIEKRSSEVWAVLGAVKTEFSRFGGLLDSVHKKLHEAANKIDDVAQKSRAIQRKLRDVQELPASDATALLPETSMDDDGEIAPTE